MAIRIAINGFGRIGRNITRALYESHQTKIFQIVAINDLSTLEHAAHLLKYDTTHGTFTQTIEHDNHHLNINHDKIAYSSEAELTKLPWKTHDVDIVLECTGQFANRQDAEKHLQAGAKKVLISAPAGTDVDATVVYGVNHYTLSKHDKIVSNASCTTNCLSPIVKILHEAFGIENGLMTTVHAYTNDQHLTDSNHRDLRRARAAAVSMIPTKTGAAVAIGRVMPELAGKLQGYAIRVPTLNVSAVDFTFTVNKPVTTEQINTTIQQAAENAFNNIIAYNDIPLVSSDFNHNPHSAIFDASQTIVVGNMVKIVAWYDNEWGFSNRMLDTALFMHQL